MALAVSDIATLQAKGFHVSDNGDGTATIRWPNAAPETAFRVVLQSGVLQLQKAKSATHRMLATELGR